MQFWRILGITFLTFTTAMPSAAAASRAKPRGSPEAPRLSGTLHLASESAVVLSHQTGKIFYAKNMEQPKAIASITKLMNAMVILDGRQPLNAAITIKREDIDMQRGSSSRLHTGMTLSRQELLRLALMSSENRAAFALARNYVGGVKGFVSAMNRKAKVLGMKNTVFYDPTGLDARNVSTAQDLALMVRAAYAYDPIRKDTTTVSYTITDGPRKVAFHNTNRLVRAKGWNIGLSKTGYISDSGKCLVMQTKIKRTPTIVVLLDSWGKNSRIEDAIKVKRWLER